MGYAGSRCAIGTFANSLYLLELTLKSKLFEAAFDSCMRFLVYFSAMLNFTTNASF